MPQELPPGFRLDDEPPEGFVVDSEPLAKSLQDFSLPQRVLATGQAGLSLLGDAAAEVAGGLAFGKTKFADSLAGLDGSNEAALAAQERTREAVRGFSAPDDPAEGLAKKEILDFASQGIDKATQLAKGATAPATGLDPNKPVGESFGDAAFELTGDPEIATLAHMVPNIAEAVAGARSAKGLKGGRGSRTAAAAEEVKGAPTLEELKELAARHYDSVDASGVRVRGESVRRMIDTLKSKDLVRGLDDRTLAAISKAEEIAQRSDLTFKEVEQIRRVLKKAAASIEPGDRRSAMQAIEAWDGFVNNLRETDISAGGGELSTTRAALSQARTLYSKARKAEEISEMFEKASVEADGLYTGAGFEHSIRKQFRQLYNNKKRLRMWNPNEQRMIKDIATGENLDRVLRTWGRMAPTGAMNAWLTFFAVNTHPIAGAVSAGAGVAKKVAERRTINRANQLDELIRGGNE